MATKKNGGATLSDANSTGGYSPVAVAVAKAVGVKTPSSATAGGGATYSDANSTGGYGPGTPTPPAQPASPGQYDPANPNTQPNQPTVNWDGTDFASYLGIWGLPADVQARVLQIFQSTQDASVAAQLAMAYIRTTGWYAQTYPGIQTAEAKGLVNNEADYRALLNQQSQIYQQYLGRAITADEFSANLNEGVNNATIGQRLQGAAIAQTNAGDWRMLFGAFGDQGSNQLSDSDLTALGQEQAGLDTPMGQILQRRLQQAQTRIQGVFKGSLATPSLSLSGGTLQSGAQKPPDIAA